MDALKIANSAFIIFKRDVQSIIREMPSDPTAGESGSAVIIRGTSETDTDLKEKRCLLLLLMNEAFTCDFVELVSLFTVSTKTFLTRFVAFLQTDTV